MSQVLFITPTTSENAFDEAYGTVLLATILRQQGISAEILSFGQMGDPADFSAFLHRGLELARAQAPAIVSFYTRCDCYHTMLQLAKLLKETLGCTIVFGGPQADITARATVREIPWVDFVCCGEGETTAAALFASVLAGKPDLSVPGLAYCRDGQVTVNPRPALLEDLDALPMADYGILQGRVFDNAVPFPLDVGRGCPFGCTYCSTNTFWGRKYRLKTPAAIVREMAACHDRYGVTNFAFEHDMFTMNRAKVLETCRLIRELPFAAAWKCSARIDCLDRELIDEMTAAGMYQVFIGIETGSPRMQKLVNKNLKLDRVMELLTYLHDKDIRIVTSFVYGFPEETEEDLSMTQGLMAQNATLKKITIQAHLCTFLPGTALSARYGQELVPAELFSDITGQVGVTECRELIQGHPALFSHFREYRTPLRSRLFAMRQFVLLLQTMEPAYGGWLRQYAGREMELYDRFVSVNEKMLAELPPKGQAAWLIMHDRLAAELGDGLMEEYCRYRKVKLTGGTEFVSFQPSAAERGSDPAAWPRGLFVVTCTRNDRGNIVTKVRKA